ncbi:MAG TPA: pseudouridine synthase [Chthoniobacterales bacterium]
MLLAFHKPYGVLSQFTADASSNRTLAEFDFPRDVYPLGRLDADSEGLLLLTDEPGMNTRLLDPRHAHERTYWALAERLPSPASLATLQQGVVIEGRKTRPCRARILDPQPEIAPRDPPVRFRKNVADVWLELILVEGRNRQVRRMTAAIGHPTLRLIRVRIGDFPLGDLPSGKWRVVSEAEQRQIFSSTNSNQPVI